MKHCAKCGKPLAEGSSFCDACGALIDEEKTLLMNTLISRMNTEAIIWLVIGAFQILSCVCIPVGIWNIYCSRKEFNLCKTLPSNPVGLVSHAESITGPIINLVLNVIFGGIIGVVGSLYYLFAVRGYILENKAKFQEIENAMVK